MALITGSMVKSISQTIEKAVNLGLSVDPAARKKLKPLQGCILEVSVRSPEISMFFEVADQQILVMAGNVKPTVRFEGSMSGIFKLITASDKNLVFKTKEVTLSGDAVRSEQIQTFIRTLKIDWEALLAEFIGDVPAHFITDTLFKGYRWGMMASSSMLQDIEEFVKYELRLLPSRSAAKIQAEAIEKLRQATEKLDQRVKRLSKTAEKA